MATTVTGNEMEEKEERRVVNGVLVEEHWWWAAASTAQLGWGISVYRKGGGDSRLMPLKAFAVSSLFVGAAATAAMASLRASGVHSVEDMKTLGANIRTGLGLHRRARDE